MRPQMETARGRWQWLSQTLTLTPARPACDTTATEEMLKFIRLTFIQRHVAQHAARQLKHCDPWNEQSVVGKLI